MIALEGWMETALRHKSYYPLSSNAAITIIDKNDTQLF